MAKTETNTGKGMAAFEKAVKRTLEIDSGGLNESGSAFHGIVFGLTELFGLSPQDAIQKAQQWESDVGFTRGESD